MGTVKNLNKWANAHTYYALDVVRIALGVILFIKGVQFMTNYEEMTLMTKPFQGVPGSMMMLHYIVPAHFVGGFLIVIGLLTRWAIIAQLPILIGAILTNFLGEMVVLNLVLATLVLLVSVFFLIYGSGKHSADYYLKMQK